MLKVITRTAIIGLFLVFASFYTANAQIASGAAVRVFIGESFAVGNKTLPAGTYTIRRIDIPGNTTTLKITGKGVSAFVDTIASESFNTPKHTRLLFQDKDGQLALSRIVVKGSREGH